MNNFYYLIILHRIESICRVYNCLNSIFCILQNSLHLSVQKSAVHVPVCHFDRKWSEDSKHSMEDVEQIYSHQSKSNIKQKLQWGGYIVAKHSISRKENLPTLTSLQLEIHFCFVQALIKCDHWQSTELAPMTHIITTPLCTPRPFITVTSRVKSVAQRPGFSSEVLPFCRDTWNLACL